ncbi:hypothetical protein NPIL_696791, partial [Nephila pilipes]
MGQKTGRNGGPLLNCAVSALQWALTTINNVKLVLVL